METNNPDGLKWLKTSCKSSREIEIIENELFDDDPFGSNDLDA